ncbi:hypothetical protein ABOM_004635 [Aspergillus bombycis]|uniref:Condensation domain-containing protein n=1 Tax=Aspergillus bombycis TaxID=109264 RepID=A0A1F8A493_9EURO|nr:hypothetical protein ABOM_004635 [Aspergillus bombycis]OGM46560.1 hypothetical protein ABOM_004635 [Aspergillus bombycis]
MAERIHHQHASLQNIIKATGVDNHQLFNTCLTVQPAMVTMTKNQSVRFQLLEAHEPTEYKVVATVILFPSHYELCIRYWDDFLSEREALDLLDRFCDTATEVATAVSSMELGTREKLLA